MFHSWPKFLVVVLVASLQCFAPLIHAHTNSAPDNHTIHTHGEEASATANIEVLDVDQHHGQTIGVAKEYKRDYTLPLFDAVVLASAILLPETVSLSPDLWRSYAPLGVRFIRPPAQAP